MSVGARTGEGTRNRGGWEEAKRGLLGLVTNYR